MPEQREVYEHYLKPFRLVEALDLKCGYEKSFKLLDGHLLRNRYLLGIEKTLLDRQKLTTICEQMQMPREFVATLFDHLDQANLVLLGFEQGVEEDIYKIYLEYWDRILRRISNQQPPHRPMTMFQGFKWSAADNRRAVVTDYVCFPKLGIDEIIERIGSLSSACSDSAAFDIAIEIITLAAERAGKQPLIYLEASEGGNPRNSFDINLYPAELSLKSIRSPVAQWFRHYAIDDGQLEHLYDEIGHRPLGHISGGIDRNGSSFFSVYYETQPRQ